MRSRIKKERRGGASYFSIKRRCVCLLEETRCAILIFHTLSPSPRWIVRASANFRIDFKVYFERFLWPFCSARSREIGIYQRLHFGGIAREVAIVDAAGLK